MYLDIQKLDIKLEKHKYLTDDDAAYVRQPLKCFGSHTYAMGRKKYLTTKGLSDSKDVPVCTIPKGSVYAINLSKINTSYITFTGAPPIFIF